jgi:hypothetical protein
MTDVIDIKTRRPWALARAEAQKARRKAKRQEKKEAKEGIEEHKAAMLEVLDGVRKLVEAGRLEGLLLIAREPKTKHFFTEVVLDDRIITNNDLHSFVGCLETLKIELADGAAMAPALMLDGSTIDPEMEPPEYEEFE